MAYFGRVIRKLLQVFIFLALPFCAYFGWIQWEVHKMQSFCGDVRPDTRVGDLPAIAERDGISTLRGVGVYEESTKSWFLPVPVMPTFGDISCLIRHDNETVKSATMDGV
jgi:hypothetical protein